MNPNFEVYAQKYLDNYSMQKALAQDQCESYRYLQSFSSVPGVLKTLSSVSQTYEDKYPYTFSMQKTLGDKMKSYLELPK